MKALFISGAIAVLCFYQPVIGQDLKPSVLSSSAGSGTQGNVNLSWTVGQPVIKTFTGTDGSSLASGVQTSNSKLLITKTDARGSAANLFSIYPNPAQDHITIQAVSSQTKAITYDLMTLDGKCVSSNTSLTTGSSIDVSGLTAGMYILKVYMDASVTSYQLIKQY